MSRKLCTIGFSQKNLRRFVQLLQEAGVTKLIDTRLYNTSQLAGYAKKDDLQFICETFGIQYAHVVDLAPTDELVNRYKKMDKDWPAFQRDFNNLLIERNAARLWETDLFHSEVNCLLCAEHKPEHCHRRLVAEHLHRAYPDIEIQHLT
ncbi:MAG TPA: DUF488 domain-containing protein [Symbiobacteriaceae bacterium]|nr:DUF488 domain-containing protein [Symbiobacteriaceae bacterium]